MLETSLTIILSTLDPRGYPHSVPMWFTVRDGAILMTTYAKSQKTLNLRRDPRCSLLVEAGEAYGELRGVLIRGRAQIDADVDAVLETLAAIRTKHGLGGLDPDPAVAAAMRAHAAKRVLLRITPERVSSWDHGKLGGAY
jgi:PPOX class probable F420-dependent enzyme